MFSMSKVVEHQQLHVVQTIYADVFLLAEDVKIKELSL